MSSHLALCYHAVRHVTADEDPFNLAVHPDRLRRHIRALRRWGWELVTYGDLVDDVAVPTGRRLAALTFDDGYDDNLDVLAPLLADEQAPATVFVTAGLLGGRHPDVPDWPLMTEAQVRELASTGIEIGSHGWAHPDLRTVDDLEDELVRSREVLEDLVGARVDTFAYPYGRTDRRVVEATRAAGYRAAGMTSGEGDWADPLVMPRQDGTRGMSLPGLWLRTHERYEPVVSTVPGRIVRRVVHTVTGRAG